MSDIRADISTACADLNAVTDTLAAVRPKGTLSDQSYEFFDLLPSFAAQIAEIHSLIDARDVALLAVNSFPNQVNPNNPATFLYNAVAVPFWQGWLLVMQSYVATCWAIYDSLSKVAGILACTDQRAKNAAKPVKLQEDFLSLPNTVGARIQDHLKGAYGWPIGLSYAIRNWLLHDGHSQGGVGLFRYNSHEVAPYQLSEEGWSKIVERCSQRYKVEEIHTRLEPFPNVQDNLATGLSVCNAEVDEAISFALLTATGGIRLQAQILFQRDS